MKKLRLLLTGLLMVIAFSGCAKAESKTITAFVGSASKPAMEEAIQVFKEKTGIQVYANYGGSGTMLSQIKISKSGDLYIPGSPDYMIMAERDGVIDPASVKLVAYLVPAILVQKGNPKNIQSLADLAKPGVEVGIGNPEAVCVGLYAYEILEYNDMLAEIGPNIVTNAESCDKTATLIVLKLVDAVLGWSVFASWHDTIDVIYLAPAQLPRLAYIPGAITRFAADKTSAREFLDFLVSEEGQEIFRKWGYITTEAEARKYAPNAQIGGEYQLPADYQP